MAESKLQYKCEKHGPQADGLTINMSTIDGRAHSLCHCFMCIAEMFARNEVPPMAPVLVTAPIEEKAENWIPEELTEKK